MGPIGFHSSYSSYESADICNAFSGQISTHSAQLTQASGRGSHGKGPDISRQRVGQTSTQSPQPVQSRSSRMGSSISIDLNSSSWRTCGMEKSGDDLGDHLARLRQDQHIGGPQVPRQSGQVSVNRLADDNDSCVRILP
jgi:hypothetical protein